MSDDHVLENKELDYKTGDSRSTCNSHKFPREKKIAIAENILPTPSLGNDSPIF